jgi:hypothetical protein
MSEVTSIHAARTASTTPRPASAAPTSGDGTSFSAALSDAGKRPESEKTEKVAGGSPVA